jgi:hypothetical protein
MTQPIDYDKASQLVQAGANVLHIASYEWERVEAWSIGLARDLGVPLQKWSCSSGLVALDAEGGSSVENEALDDPIAAMEGLKASDEGGVLLLEDIHPYLAPEHHHVTRWIREMCRLDSKPRRLLILSTPQSGLPVDLQKEVPSIDLPLPGVRELAVIAERVAEEHGVPWDADEVLLEAARGLTLMEARLAFAIAAERLRSLNRGAVPLVIREKERVIRQSQVLEYYEPDAGMADVGGLTNLKTWLDRRGKAFGAGARDSGLNAPKGALLLGVQGCGKSLTAKAVAASWAFPLLRFDMGKVFGGIVGESEGNMRLALRVAEALAPCVLWIDEIEKGLAGMGSSDRTDGGTTARVVGTFLTWMQEKKAPVFVVATANRIEMLPPELLRKGRFDEIFFIDLPTQAVREEILRIHLEKKGRKPGDFDLSGLAKRAQGFSGAEIEEAISEGMFEAYAEADELATAHIERALEATYPLSRTMGEEIEGLRRWAKARARLAASEEAEELPSFKGAPAPVLSQEKRNPFIPEPSL